MYKDVHCITTTAKEHKLNPHQLGIKAWLNKYYTAIKKNSIAHLNYHRKMCMLYQNF